MILLSHLGSNGGAGEEQDRVTGQEEPEKGQGGSKGEPTKNSGTSSTRSESSRSKKGKDYLFKIEKATKNLT